MGTSLTPASRDRVCALLARALLGTKREGDRVGDVVLRPHQHDAVRRARDAIARFGGALLADDVGSGKTFVALAIAARYSRPAVFAPAALRSMWTTACARARIAIPFVSIESLGRGRPPPDGHDLVVIDEAHHLRNPATQRYQAARQSTRGAHVLLASATPVHSVARDLDALLSLFLGADAGDASDELLAAIVIRSAREASGPRVVVHEPRAVRDNLRVVSMIRALPPPVPPRDGGEAPALLRLGLLRAWCSSVAALDAMLDRASFAASALAEALRSGRALSRDDMRAWTRDGDGQFALAGLFGEPVATTDAAGAINVISAHASAVRALRDVVRTCARFDDDRARHVEAVRAMHGGVPVLACSQYAATIGSLWARLRHRPGVCMLTSRGARIASGAIPRDAALALFAPVAHGVPAPHARERITLLLATDLVSEGLNLQDAGVVVHLDLPWTAARLAQRVGRVARMGSPHEVVHAYSIAPPRTTDALLALERRLRRKRSLGERLVGGGRQMSALLGGVAREPSAAEAYAEIEALLRDYVVPEGSAAHGDGDNAALSCALHAEGDGWLALLATPEPRLVAKLGPDRPTSDPRPVATAVQQLIRGSPIDAPAGYSRAVAQLERWIEHERASELAGSDRRHAARRLGRAAAVAVSLVSGAPPHERAHAAARANGAMANFVSRAKQRAPASAIVRALVLFCARDRSPNRSAV